MARFKITLTQWLGIMFLALCIFFCWAYYIMGLEKAYVAQTPLQRNVEILLSSLEPESFGVEVLLLCDYQDYGDNRPWYVNTLQSSKSYRNRHLVVVNQRTDSMTINVELIADTKTAGFHTLKFQDSLFVSNGAYNKPNAVKIYSLSGGIIGWINTSSLWINADKSN